MAYKQRNSGDLPVWEEWHCGQGPILRWATIFSLCPYVKGNRTLSLLFHYSVLKVGMRDTASALCVEAILNRKKTKQKHKISPDVALNPSGKQHSFITWKPQTGRQCVFDSSNGTDFFLFFFLFCLSLHLTKFWFCLLIIMAVLVVYLEFSKHITMVCVDIFSSTSFECFHFFFLPNCFG